MGQIVVHTIPGSPFARSVFATLEEKGIDYSLARITPGTLKQEPHIRRHPFGKMPVIEHDGFTLYETQAILRYIDRMFPAPALTPSDIKAAARMDQLMNISDQYLFQGVGNVIGFQRIVGPALMGLTPDEAVIAAAMPQGHTVVRELEHLLGDQPFLSGDALSLADLQVAPQLDFLVRTPEWEALRVDAPRLDAWLTRINARPSMLATTWEKVSAMAA